MSYIKGSKEAVCSESGDLSLQQYTSAIGRKRAPNFDEGSRSSVYEIYRKYK